jgi:signal transduction histidine kinase
VNSLRGRIAALAALVALLATTVCAWVGSWTTDLGVADQRRRSALEEIADLRHHLDRLGQTLAHEVLDHATGSGLHAAIPALDPERTRINLAPGNDPGGVAQAMIVVAGGRVLGRFSHLGQRGEAPSTEDPAGPATVAALAEGTLPAHGLAVLDGRPTLFAAAPILRSDRSGPAAGVLVGLAYLDSRVLDRVRLGGWRFAIAGLPDADPREPTAEDGGNGMTATAHLAARGGAVAVTLGGAPDEGGADGVRLLRANQAIILAGLATALVATSLGIVLGWRWVHPLSALAAACRRRAADPDQPLPTVRGLPEAEVLAEALGALVEAERRNHDALSAALDREITANAVHQRFLAQLGHEFGQPVRALIAIIDRLAAEGGRLPPEELAHARVVALALEERFQEVLGLASEAREVGGSERDVASYLGGVADLLRPIASRRGLRLEVEAPNGPAMIDGRLLTPILVNLATNAIRATASGEVRLSVVVHPDHSTRWTVADSGPGIEAGLAERIADACARGEVLPGTAGLGLGLALALANTRALGGRLRLERSGGEGTTFVLAVPPPKPGYGSGLYPWRRAVEASAR